jgi:NlpC/P60 family putative phage cell wall peptidase
MVSRADIVAEARAWIGTPFQHQAHSKGVAADCAGVIRGVPQALGLYPGVEIQAYLRQPDPRRMRAALLEHLDPVPFKAVLPGDVLHFRIDIEPQHLAIVTELEPLRAVHATSRPKVSGTVEFRVDAWWRQRLAGCYRYRGLSD